MELFNFDFDKIHDDLNKGCVIKEQVVQDILLKLAEILNEEDNLLILQSPINIVGDIHGQYEDLCELFDKAGGFDQKYLFMGDYVDRGYFSLNTFLLLAILKIQNPNQIFLLRGNHECRKVTKTYGLYTEIMVNYGSTNLWARVMDVFDLLPLAALVDNDIFSVHGGLSPSLPLISVLNDINRRREIPDEGPIADLLWSDPSDDKRCIWDPVNPRGAGFLFGAEPAIKFCHLNRLRLVTRSHQVAQEGYVYYFRDNTKIPDGRVLLVWSAPNYCYTNGNAATFLKITNDNCIEHQKDRYNLVFFEERKDRLKRDEDISSSPYFA